MRRKLEVECVFPSSVKLLFPRISTADGLAEWFADEVHVEGKRFTFCWDETEQYADLLELQKNEYVRFRWLDKERKDEYFEFRLHIEPLTEDVALIVTDFVRS